MRFRSTQRMTIAWPPVLIPLRPSPPAGLASPRPQGPAPYDGEGAPPRGRPISQASLVTRRRQPFLWPGIFRAKPRPCPPSQTGSTCASFGRRRKPVAAREGRGRANFFFLDLFALGSPQATGPNPAREGVAEAALSRGASSHATSRCSCGRTIHQR